VFPRVPRGERGVPYSVFRVSPVVRGACLTPCSPGVLRGERGVPYSVFPVFPRGSRSCDNSSQPDTLQITECATNPLL
jgi:hypothetical protein